MQWKTRAKDVIYSGVYTDKGREEFDRIFGKDKEITCHRTWCSYWDNGGCKINGENCSYIKDNK